MAIHRDSTFPRALVPTDIGGRVRAERLARRWSQERLAAKLNVSRRTVIRLELGQHVPTAHLVHAIEDILELPKLVPAGPSLCALRWPATVHGCGRRGSPTA